jgi:hypothetical protein
LAGSNTCRYATRSHELGLIARLLLGPFRPTSSSSGEFIHHQLAAAVLPVSAANRFPDQRTVMMDLPTSWTLSIASVVPQYLSRADSELADTLIGHIRHQ